jgi:hypothetical protein
MTGGIDMKYVLKNDHAHFVYNPDGRNISGSDYTDRYNEPRCYNKTRRGIGKAWEALERQWNKDLTMQGAMMILHDNKIRMHSYCAVD